MVQPIRKAFLPDFKQDLAARCNETPSVPLTTYTALEEEGNQLLSLLQESRDAFFPARETTSHSSMHYWMNDYIRNKRDNLSDARKKAARERKPRYSDDYKADEKNYEALVSNARTTSFRQFTAEVNSAKDRATGNQLCYYRSLSGGSFGLEAHIQCSY